MGRPPPDSYPLRRQEDLTSSAPQFMRVYTDFLLCAVAERHRFPILTTNEDFVKFIGVLPLRLHAQEK